MKSYSKQSVVVESFVPKDGGKHILVLAGGLSAEREVSLASSTAVVKALKSLGYAVTLVDMGNDIPMIINQLNPDVVFNCLHGGYGENGAISGLLDIMEVPYTHSGVLSSAVGLDKITSRAIFEHSGIKCPEALVVHKGDLCVSDPMPRPYVIKPVSEGSSIGVHVIFPEDDFLFQDYRFEHGDKILVERYIPGMELQVAIVDDKAVGILEIVPKGRFYDYEAKYVPGMATHIMPARVSNSEAEKILNIAEKAHQALGCSGVSRVEFRYDGNEAYILEVNTHPGMTSLSIVPEIASYYGIGFEQIVQKLAAGAKFNK